MMAYVYLMNKEKGKVSSIKKAKNSLSFYQKSRIMSKEGLGQRVAKYIDHLEEKSNKIATSWKKLLLRGGIEELTSTYKWSNL